MRWPHPARGMVSPAEFIPVAEEMGLIVEIGNFVLREACLECAKWPGDVRVAVNLSAIQFRRGNVAESIAMRSPAAGLAAEPARDRDHRIGVPRRHRAHAPLAARAAGDGRADLARRFRHRLLEPQLPAQLPLNKVKIDRSFLQGVDTQPSAAQAAARRRAAERRPRHVRGGGGHRDRGAACTRRAASRAWRRCRASCSARAMPSVEIRKMLLRLRAASARSPDRQDREPPAGAPCWRRRRPAHEILLRQPSSGPAIGALAVDDGLDLAAVDADIVQDAVVEAAQQRDGCELRPPRPIGLPPAPESAGRARARAGTAGRGCGYWMTWLPPMACR